MTNDEIKSELRRVYVIIISLLAIVILATMYDCYSNWPNLLEVSCKAKGCGLSNKAKIIYDSFSSKFYYGLCISFGYVVYSWGRIIEELMHKNEKLEEQIINTQS